MYFYGIYLKFKICQTRTLTHHCALQSAMCIYFSDDGLITCTNFLPWFKFGYHGVLVEQLHDTHFTTQIHNVQVSSLAFLSATTEYLKSTWAPWSLSRPVSVCEAGWWPAPAPLTVFMHRQQSMQLVVWPLCLPVKNLSKLSNGHRQGGAGQHTHACIEETKSDDAGRETCPECKCSCRRRCWRCRCLRRWLCRQRHQWRERNDRDEESCGDTKRKRSQRKWRWHKTSHWRDAQR